jgi:hypothetical protein
VGAQADVGERDGETEEHRACGVLVPAFEAVEEFVAEWRGELACVELESRADGSDVARVDLKEIDVLGYTGRVAEQSHRRDRARHRASEQEIHSESGVARVFRGLLRNELQLVELEGGVVEIEHPNWFVCDAGRLKLCE